MANCYMEDMTTLYEWTLKKGEMVTDYFYSLMDLCNKFDPPMPDETRRDIFKHGLPDEYCNLIIISPTALISNYWTTYENRSGCSTIGFGAAGKTSHKNPLASQQISTVDYHNMTQRSGQKLRGMTNTQGGLTDRWTAHREPTLTETMSGRETINGIIVQP